MAKILTYRRWSYALHLFRRWLSNKFSAIKIDLTPVEEKVDEVSDKIDDIKDTFDADMALQLQGIIGEGEESVEGNSQTEGEIDRLRTLQESYDDLANNRYATTSEVAEMDAEILTPYE